ncbi:MAG: hypothetical protein WBA51_12750 [Erythrobacter sp.]
MTLPLKEQAGAQVQGLGGSVCDLSLDRIEWARAAAHRLKASGLEASIAPARREVGEWYTGQHLAFAPLREVPLLGAPAEEWMRILSAQEDILADIEQALGVAAEFADVRPLSDDWPALIVHRDGQALCHLVILNALNGADYQAPSFSPPVLLQAGFIAARLSISEAEALEPGDMLVLNSGPWPLLRVEGGALHQPGIPPLGYDPLSGTLTPLLTEDAPPFNGALGAMSLSDTPSPETAAGGLSVPVAIHLADIAITQAELARMAQTGTFDLGAVTQGLSAQLSVGGRSIGRGEIVRIGDRFAVLLEGSESVDSAPAAPENTEDPAQSAGPGAADVDQQDGAEGKV